MAPLPCSCALFIEAWVGPRGKQVQDVGHVALIRSMSVGSLCLPSQGHGASQASSWLGAMCLLETKAQRGSPGSWGPIQNSAGWFPAAAFYFSKEAKKGTESERKRLVN